MQRVRRIALTGGIATGKSHVLATIAAAGIPTVDTDATARDVVQRDSRGHGLVVERFGTGILDHDGGIDRKVLARIVFRDADARRDLEAIIHPLVRERTEQWFLSLDPLIHPIGVVAIPLLYEAGREHDFDVVIATVCAPATQLQRLMKRDQLSEDEARARLAAQLPAVDKAARADYVVNTEGSVEQTDEQVRSLVQRLEIGDS